MLVGSEYYRLLTDVDPTFAVIKRDCPCCGRSRHACVNVDVPIRVKHWQPFPETAFMQCQDCDCVFNESVPNDALMSFLYRYMYRAQSPGDHHFRHAFGDVRIIGDTLEIGPGTNGGLKSRVDGRYFDVGPDAASASMPCADFDPASLVPVKNVVACDVIEHMTSPIGMFELAARVLSPDGTFWVTVGEQHDGVRLPANMQTTHITSFSQRSLVSLAARHGLIAEHMTEGVSGAGWVFKRA